VDFAGNELLIMDFNIFYWLIDVVIFVIVFVAVYYIYLKCFKFKRNENLILDKAYLSSIFQETNSLDAVKGHKDEISIELVLFYEKDFEIPLEVLNKLS